MGWTELIVPITEQTATLPTLEAGAVMFAEDRKRLNLHDGARWRELAYRDEEYLLASLVMSELKRQPSEAFPCVPRWLDQDIDIAHWPKLVPALRAEKAEVKGVTDFQVSVSGSTVTFVDTDAARFLLALLMADAMVSSYLNLGEPANFQSTFDFATQSTLRSINVGGTDYPIYASSGPAISQMNRTVTVQGTPPQGTQTACVYPYRIAGSASTARLLRIAGFAPVGAGDAGIEVVGGFRRMDRGQGHKHLASAASSGGLGTNLAGFVLTSPNNGSTTGNPTPDDANGTPRIGKTTDPRTASQWFYTHGLQYVA